MIIYRLISGQRYRSQNILNRWCVLSFAVFSMSGLLGCGADAPQKDEVVVFAAASLQGAMQEVAESYQAEYGIPVRLNFAPSGVLARQIQAGAGADVFISASKNWIDEVSHLDFGEDGSVIPLLSNSLVVVTNKSTGWELDSIEQLNALPFRQLVMGDPEFVPAGKYAQQFLQSIAAAEDGTSLWDCLTGRICPTSDLRRILALVESDRSLIGIVYATDATDSPDVRVIYQVPNETVSVDYFLVTLKLSALMPDGRHAGNDFRQYLLSQPATIIFERHGFASHGKSN